MRISTKVVFGMLGAAFLPMFLFGLASFLIAGIASAKSHEAGTKALLVAEADKLGQRALDKAAVVGGLLRGYREDVDQLRSEAGLGFRAFPDLTNSWLSGLHAGRDSAGLPAYGYVDSVWGSYAN